MKTALLAIALTAFAAAATLTPAAAATVKNSDKDSHVLVVVENGNRMEVVVDAGASAEICPAGCFLTMPNGDREALTGGETVEIRNGAALIK